MSWSARFGTRSVLRVTRKRPETIAEAMRRLDAERATLELEAIMDKLPHPPAGRALRQHWRKWRNVSVLIRRRSIRLRYRLAAVMARRRRSAR